MSQGRRRYVANETTCNVSVERRQDVSVVRLHDVLLECRYDVSRGRYETPNDISMVRHQDVPVVRVHDVPLVHLYDVSCNSQTKHPMTSL